MSKPKNHHTTAITYLKYFSPDAKRVYRYDKQVSQMQFLSINVLGFVKNMYTIIRPDGEKDTSIENPFFSNMDGGYNVLIKKLRACEHLETLREELIRLMASQYARVEPQRNRWNRIFSSLNEQRRELGVPKEKLQKIDGGQLNISMLMEMGVYANAASGSFFSILVAQDKEFLTCDNPADKAMLPLTFDMCLLMPSDKPTQQYANVTLEVVDRMNRITFDKAKRFVYAKSEATIQQFANTGTK